MNRNGRLFVLFLTIIICIATPLMGKTKQEVLRDAADYFVREAVRIPHGSSVFVGRIINSESRENDTLGRDLESDFYFELERLASDFKLFLDQKPSTEDDIQVLGSYMLEGSSTRIRLKVFQGVKNKRVLAMFQGEYESQKTRDRMLVAILDLEAEFMAAASRKAFSEIMRSSFSRKGAFDIVNSADVDKLDSDAIQQASGCTRDECATVIGEQLGVDRVVSSSVYRVNDDLFVVSGKIINIRDGSIVKSRTVKHGDRIETLDSSIELLVDALIDDVSTEVEEVPEETEASPWDFGDFNEKDKKNKKNDNRFKMAVEPFVKDITTEIKTAFSTDADRSADAAEDSFNIDTLKFGGLGLGWSKAIGSKFYFTSGISYAPGIISDDDLLLHVGGKFVIPRKLVIFNFHVGSSLVYSRNDGLRNPYISLGTDFLFMYMGFDIPTSKLNQTDVYFGFKFTD